MSILDLSSSKAYKVSPGVPCDVSFRPAGTSTSSVLVATNSSSCFDSGSNRGTLLSMSILGSLTGCSIFCIRGDNLFDLRPSASGRGSLLPELWSHSRIAGWHRGAEGRHRPFRRHRRLDGNRPAPRSGAITRVAGAVLRGRGCGADRHSGPARVLH